MNCSNCGANINQGEAFCRSCGVQITSQNVQSNSIDYSNINQQNNVQVQQNYVQAQPNVGYTQSVYNNTSNDEALINAYIGKNVDKLKKGDFSPNTFFFGNIYVFYRKMWLLGVIWLLAGMIITMFLSSLSGVLTMAANIVISIQFKKWYLKHVEEQVAKIKSENPTATHEQLLTICSKKGGTTIIPIIIAVILYIAIIVAVIVFLIVSTQEIIKDQIDNLPDEYPETTNDDSIGNLSLIIPTVLEASNSNSNSYKSYSIYDDKDYCTLTVSTSSASYYESPSEYLEKNVYYSSNDTVSTIQNKVINGNDWSFMSVEKTYSTTYHYAGQNDNKIYDIEFRIAEDSGVCSSAHSTIVNSLKFN